MKNHVFKSSKTSEKQSLRTRKIRVILRDFVKKRVFKGLMSNDRVPLCNMDRKEKKSIQAINFLINKSPNKVLDKLGVIKLLWIADKYHLLKYGRTIVRDKYFAMPHGPVASKTLNNINSKIDYVAQYIKPIQGYIRSVSDADESFFSESDIEVLNLVWENFGDLPYWQLRNLTHEYPEWQKFEKDILDKSKPSSYSMDIDDFFNLPKINESNKADFFHSIPKGFIEESLESRRLRRKFESA